MILKQGAARQPPPKARPASEAMPRSGMGVASMVMAIISLVNILILIIVVVAVHDTFQPNDVEDSPFHYLLGGWTLGIGLLCVCGIVFGIGGLRQTNRRRTVATVGLCLNIAIPILIMFFMLLIQTLNSTDADANVAHAAPVAADSPPWRSPFAITFQALTIGMGVALFAYYRKKHVARQENAPIHAVATIACQRCKKRVPVTSKFCRRCGNAMHVLVSG